MFYETALAGSLLQSGRLAVTTNIWRHDTQHSDTQHNDTQHSDIQHKKLIYDTQYT